MEREVREMLQAKSNRAPSMEEPSQPVLRRARTRKATNSIGLAAIVAIFAVGSIAGVRSLTATQKIAPDTPRGPVPWAPIPEPQPGAELPCLARDLTLAADAGTGSSLVFAGKSPDIRCTIVPTFGLRLLDAKGNALDVRVDFASTFSGVIVVGTARRAALFDWANGCAPTTGPIRFSVTFPENFGTLSAVASNGGELTCTGSRSPTTLTFVAGGSTQISDAFASQSLLESSLSGVPRSALAGETLRYFVVLHNPTRKPINLDPCPSFTASVTVGVAGPRTGGRWLLNCGEAPPTIRPGATLRFAMEFVLPTDTGPAELSWELPELSVPAVTAHFTIT
jgi:hypothetical protein